MRIYCLGLATLRAAHDVSAALTVLIELQTGCCHPFYIAFLSHEEKKGGQPAFAQTGATIYNLPCTIYSRQPNVKVTCELRSQGPIKQQCKQPVGRHGEHGPLIDLFGHMDVLLTRDGDLLWLVFEELDIIVDVENVFTELCKVVELRRKAGGRALTRQQTALSQKKKSFLTRCYVKFLHLFPDGELQALHQLLLLEAMKVLMKVFLPPGGIWHKVVVLVKENHRLLSYAEEYDLLFARWATNNSFLKANGCCLLPTSATTSRSNWK